MEKKCFFIIILVLTSVLAITLVNSEDFPNYYDKYVDDFAKILSVDQTAYLRNLFYQAELNTTSQVVFASIETLNGYESSDYATQLFTKWQIGQSDKDNGLLILYAKQENKIWVTTGYGLEGILPDSKIGRILDDYYVPLRDSNKTSEGIIAASEQFVQVINENRDEVLSGNTGQGKNVNTEFIIWIIIIVIFFIIPSIIRAFVGKKKIKRKNSSIWDILFWMWIGNSLGRSGGGFSGGGFGGGGFGGGATGGGGAGR